MDTPNKSQVPDDKPPLFHKWSGWYTLVLSSLAIIIVLLFIFTKAYL